MLHSVVYLLFEDARQNFVWKAIKEFSLVRVTRNFQSLWSTKLFPLLFTSRGRWPLRGQIHPRGTFWNVLERVHLFTHARPYLGNGRSVTNIHVSRLYKKYDYYIYYILYYI